MRKHLRFFQFGARQLALLFVVLSVLLAVAAPGLQRVYVSRQVERSARRLWEAHADLVEAVRENDVALAEKALKDGASPNQIVDQCSLLHRCIERGQIPLIELLLEAGVDVDRVERLRRSPVAQGPPLYAAIGSSQPTGARLEVMRLLVDHGANAHTPYGGRSAMDVAVYHADSLVADLLKELGLPYGPREMAAFNRLDEIRTVVESDPEVLVARYRPVYAARPGQGPTLLGIALERGFRDMAKFLIESGAPLDTVEGLGQTPLHLAARGGDPQLIRLLIDHGLDVQAKDEYEDTPLTDSVSRAPPEAISVLIEAGADVNQRGLNGRTALHMAVRAVAPLPAQADGFSERMDVIRILLAAGADRSIPDRRGETALVWARDNNLELAKLLDESLQTHGQ